MNKWSDQRGVALIAEVTLVAAVLAIVGFGVFTETRQQSSPTAAVSFPSPSASASPTPSSSPSPIPVAAKSGLLAAQKISFSYPASWSLTNKSTPVPGDPGVISDTAILTSPGGLTVSLQTGLVGVGGACGPSCKAAYSEPLSVLGQPLYLNYQSEDSGKDVSTLMVASSATCASLCYIAPSNRINGNSTMYFSAYYGSGSSQVAKPLSAFQVNNPDVMAAKAIFTSLKYVQ